jgi:hypothetical protein
MKHLFLGTIVSGLILFSAPGFAQDRDRDRHEGQGQGYENRDEGYFKGRLFERIREDIDRVQANTPAFGGDEFRLQRVKQELNEMHQGAVNGKFEDRQLDDVANALQKVIADNRMPERDRTMLQDDLKRLQDYKANHERYYPRG